MTKTPKEKAIEDGEYWNGWFYAKLGYRIAEDEEDFRALGLTIKELKDIAIQETKIEMLTGRNIETEQIKQLQKDIKEMAEEYTNERAEKEFLQKENKELKDTLMNYGDKINSLKYNKLFVQQQTLKKVFDVIKKDDFKSVFFNKGTLLIKLKKKFNLK